MRLIAGTAGGIPLLSPRHDARPTTDRVREAVFSKLADRFADAAVADLFAGSGAYGLEALSRGARSAVLVEKNRLACEVIRRNAEKARLTEGLQVRQSDAFDWLKGQPGPFPVVFADPPYKKAPEDEDFAGKLLTGSGLATIVAPDGVLVLESFAGRGRLEVPATWTLLDQRTYGSSLISYLTPTPRQP